MAVKKITKRWIFNSFGIILVLVIAIVIGVSLSVKSYYYNGVRQYILSRRIPFPPSWWNILRIPPPVFFRRYGGWWRNLSTKPRWN